MKTVKKEKPAVSCRRGQWHKHKLFTVTLVLDPTLKKLDSNTIRKKRDIIEKKKVRIEKKNADPEYFRSVMYDNFPRLAGQEFNLWRMYGDKPELVQLPEDVNNAVALCSTEELNRSHLYIKPLHAAVVVLDAVLTATTVKPELDTSAQNLQSTNHQNVHQDQDYNENDDIDDDDLPSLPAMVTKINSSQAEPSSLAYTSTHDIPPSSVTMSVYTSLGYQHFPTYEQPLIYTTAAQSNTSLSGVVDAKTSGTALVENKAQPPDVANSPMTPYTYMEPMSVGSFQKLLADPITPMQYILPDNNFMPNDAPASSNLGFPSSYLSIDHIIRNGVPDVPNANQVNLSDNVTGIRDIVVQSSHPFTSAFSWSDMPAKRLRTDPHSQNSNEHQISLVYQQASITSGLYTSNDISAICCGICLKNLPVEPITLPCLELFCLNCLEAHIHETSLPSCPICLTYFHIPDGGLKDMPFNGFVEKVVALRRIANQETSDKLCEVCSKEYTLSSSQGAANIPLAESYCLDCQEKFCKSCTKCHKSMKMARHHNMVDLGLNSSDQVFNMWKQKEQFCKNHMKEAQKIHCHDCEQLVCLQCHEEEHSQHDCTFFNEIAEDAIKQELQSYTDNLMKDISVREKNIDVMTNDCDQRAKDLEMVREGIKWKVAKLKSEIDQCEIELMLNCDEYQRNYIDKAKSNLEKHKQLVSKSSRLAGFMKLLKDLGSGFDLIRFNPTICQKTKNASSSDFAFWPDKLQRIEFTPSDVTTDIQGLVGLLRLKPALEETCDTATLQSQNSSASHNDQKIQINSNTAANQSFSSDLWFNLTPDYLPSNPNLIHESEGTVDNRLTLNAFSLVSNTIAAAATVKLNQHTVATNTTTSVAGKANTITVVDAALTSTTSAAGIDAKSVKEDNLGCNSSLAVLQSKPGTLQLKLLKRSLPHEGYGSTMAELSGRIYIVECSTEIAVYDSKSFERLDDIEVKSGRFRLYAALYIASCTINKCLYIFDYVLRKRKGDIIPFPRIWQVKVQEAICKIWLSHKKIGPCNDDFSLSVTSDGRVLLCYEDPPSLKIYSSAALLLNIVPLSTDVFSLLHAVVSLSGNYIICGRSRSSVTQIESSDEERKSPDRGSESFMISEVTVEGQMIRSFDDGTVGKIGTMINADNMSQVDEDGRVYLVDTWSQQEVYVIDSTLSHCQLLLSKNKDDVVRPKAVLYSRDNKQLTVLHDTKEYQYQLSVYQVETAYSNSIV